MFGIQIKLTATPKRLERATDKGAFKTLRHSAFSIRKSAIGSMKFAKGPSTPGTPPHSHKGRLRRSILVAQDGNDEVFVGASGHRIKAGRRPEWLARMLEHGGTFRVKIKKKRKSRRDTRGRFVKSTESAALVRSITFPPRPFMQPALQRNLARFHRDWKGAI